MSNEFFGVPRRVSVLPRDMAQDLQAAMERIAHEVRGDNPMAYADGERWRFKVNMVEMTGTVRGDSIRSDGGQWYFMATRHRNPVWPNARNWPGC